MAYQQYSVTVRLADLVMHNGQTADPLNKFAKAMKAISGKRGKTDADHEALARIEYEAGLYTNGQGQVIVPGRVIESVIAEGSKKSKEGRIALSSTFVDNDPVISYDGGPLSVEQLIDSDQHRLAVPVKVGMAKVIRTRPHFHNVEFTFLVSLETTLANEAQLQRWIEAGLNQVGFGDWRPRHGRGELVAFGLVQQPVKLAA